MIDASKLKNALKKSSVEAQKKLNEIRNEIQKIDDEVHWLDSSPLPLSDAFENIDNFIEKKSNNEGIKHFFYEHKLGGENFFGAKTVFGHASLRAHEHGMVTGSGLTDISKIICSLFASTVQPALKQIATQAAKDIESGPPLNERPQLIADLLKKQFAFEVEEEQLICTAEELGLNGFYRRADCNPEIVLMKEEA